MPVFALSTFGLVLVAVVVLVLLLMVGGFVASGREARRREAELKARVERADADLAAAHAGDHGWDAAQMEAAARAAWEGSPHAGEPIDHLQLVQVVDHPGTEADEAVYRIRGRHGHEHEIVLKRVGGAWQS